MITNAREYQITRAQLMRLASALASARGRSPAEGVEPAIHSAELAALEGEMERLQRDITLYESLLEGTTVSVVVDTLDRLPDALIQARIANKWSQKQLGERLGLHEQQVQRYESTRYRGASFERLIEVARALGVRVNQTVLFAAPALGVAKATLQRLGMDDEFIEERITGSTDEDTSDADALGRILHVFEWRPEQLAGRVPFSFPEPAVAGARFKLPAGRDQMRVEAYTAYAYRLAVGAANCARAMPLHVVPSDAREVRQQLLRFGEITLRTVVDWAWSLGVVLLPLRDPGTFHGAFWRIEGRNVIVLKQRTSSADRLAHDALHELFHASREPERAERSVIDTDNYLESTDGEEEAATEFASDVLLDGRANKLAVAAATSAHNREPALKAAVERTAKAAGVSVGALANHLAWVLSRQSPPRNWWGTAQNLQKNGSEDYQFAKQAAFSRLQPPPDAGVDEDLLFRALRAED